MLHIKKIKEYLQNEICLFSNLFNDILNNCKCYNEYDIFLLSVCNRSIDVLDTISYAAKKYNINTLYPLIRLQIDNCLVLQAALIHKNNIKFFEKLFDNGFQLRLFKSPIDGIPLSERQIAKMISNDNPDFFNSYDYCCDFVHFTRQALHLSVRDVQKMTFYLNCTIGNKEQKHRIELAISHLQGINKTLINLIQKCDNQFPRSKC